MEDTRKKILIFASGSAIGGGSGARVLCEKSASGEANFQIVGLVSNHAAGGVFQLANEYGIPFIHFAKSFTAENYQRIVKESGADFVALSGWLKRVTGLDPQTTFNIHPGPLPRFGGKGMYGHFVHEAVMEAYRKNEVFSTAITMHFVTEQYDEGPAFFRLEIPILPSDTPEKLAKRVNALEHEWQWKITEKLVNGEISWDGGDPATLQGAISI